MDKKISVLIVEDDKNIRDLYTMALENVGFVVLQAVDGGEGVVLALKHHPGAILMDVGLPTMSGHKAVHEIRKDTWGKDAKIIYLTNRDDVENISRAVEQKTEKYIIKANTEVKDVVNLVRTIAHS